MTTCRARLGDGDKKSEIMYGQGKNIVLDRDGQNLFYKHEHDKPNEPTKEGPLSYVHLESLSVNSQQWPPPLESLCKLPSSFFHLCFFCGKERAREMKNA
jgi:hypothetical protein